MLNVFPEPFNPFRFVPGVCLMMDYPYNEFSFAEGKSESAPTLPEPLPKTIYQKILEDVAELPLNDWSFEDRPSSFDERKTWTTISHKKLSYSLHGCLMYSYDNPQFSISGIYRDDIFTKNEQIALKNVLVALRNRLYEQIKENRKQEEDKKLKALFPTCEV